MMSQCHQTLSVTMSYKKGRKCSTYSYKKIYLFKKIINIIKKDQISHPLYTKKKLNSKYSHNHTSLLKLKSSNSKEQYNSHNKN